MEEDQANARLAQQDEFIDPPDAREVLIPPDRLATHEHSDTSKKCTTREVWARSTVLDVPQLAVITKPVTRTHAGTGCAQNWRRVKEEKILPENRHVWTQGNRCNPVHQATRAVSEEWDRRPEKCFGEGMKRM